MLIAEDKIFQRYTPDFVKLEKYKRKDFYIIEKLFDNAPFKAIVTIDKNGKICADVIDLENNEKYLLLRIDNNKGGFADTIRVQYQKILINIRDNFFIRKYFIYPQSNEITNLLIDIYGDYPEFLWEKFEGSGIFRNKNTKKWYAAILDVDYSKLNPDKKGLIEVINVKLPPIEIEKLLKRKNFYPAYHMNKKHWITMILNNSLNNEKIMELIQKSRILSEKK